METEKKTQNSQKRVLITGCSSGFGLLAAVGAAKLGFETIATMRNPDKSGPLQEALKAASVSACIEKLDVTKPESITELAEKIGPVDILVNNAGILITGSFLDQTDEELRRIFETNYFGIVNLTRAFIPAMIERGSGRVINIASLAGLIGHPFNAAYAASKHALIGFNKCIRVELAPLGIDAVSIEPGYHRTEIIGANANQSENFYDRRSPMFEWNRGFLRTMFDEIIPRAGDPKDVADLILKFMTLEKPKPHYVIGKDARFATTLQWLGLGPWLEHRVVRMIRKYRRLENKREAEKKARRKQKRGAEATR
ncbi:MAG: SDR family oxidoreductase [Planctomycetota bacterium]|jgi:NAD(P)-dependent dehydrogenase (short-subunit alcohol dehydrogenase family)